LNFIKLSTSTKIAQLIAINLIGPSQFCNQIQFLSGTLPGNLLHPAIFETDTDNITQLSQEILFGLYASAGVGISGASITLSSGDYLAYQRNADGLLESTKSVSASSCMVCLILFYAINAFLFTCLFIYFSSDVFRQ
jgi:hypothetical protein